MNCLSLPKKLSKKELLTYSNLSSLLIVKGSDSKPPTLIELFNKRVMGKSVKLKPKLKRVMVASPLQNQFIINTRDTCKLQMKLHSEKIGNNRIAEDNAYKHQKKQQKEEIIVGSFTNHYVRYSLLVCSFLHCYNLTIWSGKQQSEANEES
jgi:hypothetical protein